METSPTNTNDKIYSALSKLQADLKPIPRTAEVNAGTYKFKYAPLDEIMNVLYPLLGKNGLSIRHELTPEGIEAVLSHESGQELRSGKIKVLTTGDMKNIGGQITYARRYTTTMVLGIASEEDTDAQGLSNVEKAPVKLDVEKQMKQLSATTSLVELKKVWTSFTPAQRENAELIALKEEMKDIHTAEAQKPEPVVDYDEPVDNEEPPN